MYAYSSERRKQLVMNHIFLLYPCIVTECFNLHTSRKIVMTFKGDLDGTILPTVYRMRYVYAATELLRRLQCYSMVSIY